MDTQQSTHFPSGQHLDDTPASSAPLQQQEHAPLLTQGRNSLVDDHTETGPDQTNQRRAERHDLKVEVSAQSDHQFFTGFSENISSGGLFIGTYQILPIGTKFKLSFSVPGVDRTFEASCEVRWLREYNENTPDVVPGVGVRFVGLDSQDEQILDAILQRVETMFYDD